MHRKLGWGWVGFGGLIESGKPESIRNCLFRVSESSLWRVPNRFPVSGSSISGFRSRVSESAIASFFEFPLVSDSGVLSSGLKFVRFSLPSQFWFAICAILVSDGVVLVSETASWWACDLVVQVIVMLGLHGFLGLFSRFCDTCFHWFSGLASNVGFVSLHRLLLSVERGGREPGGAGLLLGL